MSDATEQLNPLSEMLALSSYGNTKNIIVAVAETSGPFDEQAAKLAVQVNRGEISAGPELHQGNQ